MVTALAGFRPKYRMLWLLGVYTGLRVSDLLHLRVRDIKPLLDISERKTGKKRSVQVDSNMLAIIENYVSECRLGKSDYLIFSQPWKKDKPLSRSQAWRIIARISNQKGLQRIGTHSMRKTFATELFNATGNVDAVQRALNHRHTSTTLAYLLGNGKKLAIVDAD